MCQWFYDKNELKSGFSIYIWLSDEAHFLLSGSRVRSSVVSDLHSETKDSQFESIC